VIITILKMPKPNKPKGQKKPISAASATNPSYMQGGEPMLSSVS